MAEVEVHHQSFQVEVNYRIFARTTENLVKLAGGFGTKSKNNSDLV